LKIAVPTRWNSTFIMLQSIEKNFSLIYEVLLEKKEEQYINKIDRTRLQQLLAFLEPFYRLTCKFSSQSEETLSEVWGTVTDLSEYLNSQLGQLDLEADDDAVEFPDLNQMKLNMKDGLETLVGRNHKRLVITDHHRIASVLDPRQKRLPFLNNAAKEIVYEKVISQMLLIAAELSMRDQASNEGGSETPSTSASNSTYCFGANRFYMLSSRNADQEVDVKQELESYLTNNFVLGFAESALQSPGFPLLFWRQKGEQWPTLRMLARKYLAIPATSVPSEQIFSLASRVLGDRRSMMSGKVLEMSVFCKKNLKEW
jgi:hypothetical protein